MPKISLRLTSAILFIAGTATAFLIKMTDPLESSFQMKYGGSLDISVAADQYEPDAVIIPGEPCPYDPYIKNSGSYDAYVFLEVTLPDQTFHLDSLNENWQLLKTDGNTSIYAYGSDSAMKTLEKSNNSDGTDTPSLTNSIIIEADTDLPEAEYTVSATGYAIQSRGLDQSKPSEVWNMIQSEISKEDQENSN